MRAHGLDWSVAKGRKGEKLQQDPVGEGVTGLVTAVGLLGLVVIMAGNAERSSEGG